MLLDSVGRFSKIDMLCRDMNLNLRVTTNIRRSGIPDKSGFSTCPTPCQFASVGLGSPIYEPLWRPIDSNCLSCVPKHQRCDMCIVMSNHHTQSPSGATCVSFAPAERYVCRTLIDPILALQRSAMCIARTFTSITKKIIYQQHLRR